MRIYHISSFLFCLVLALSSRLCTSTAPESKNQDAIITKGSLKEEFIINGPDMREQFGKAPVLGASIRTGAKAPARISEIVRSPGADGGVYEKEFLTRPWEKDGAWFCTLYGALILDFPVGLFSNIYASSVGAEITIIGEKRSKWGIHPTLRYRMFRLQTIGKANRVASVFEGHGLGIGAEYRYGINLPAINRKLYLHAGFFNGLMVMKMLSDNYPDPIYDATYMLGLTAGVSIRLWEYLMAMISFQYMPVFTAGVTTQFVSLTFSMGVRI